MGTYANPGTGVNQSDFVTNLVTPLEAVRSHERGSSVPSILVPGLIHACLNSTLLTTVGAGALGLTEAIVYYKGTSAWSLLMDPNQRQVNAGGTIPFVADQPMGGFKLTGLAAGSANGHSVRYEQVVLLAGSTMTGTLGFSGSGKIVNGSQVIDANTQKIINLAAPSSSNDAARKADVDAAGPVVGTFTLSPGGSANVALAFTPSRVVARWTRSGQSSALTVFDSGSVDVAETDRFLSLVSGTTYSDAVDLTRRSGTPVLGFTMGNANGGTLGGGSSDVTVWYEAWR